MMKECWVDLETTGLNEEKYGVNQISGIIEIDGIEKEEFDFKVKPLPGVLINKGALEIQNVTVEELRTYPPAEEAYANLINILEKYVNKFDKKDKFFFFAYNARFDNDFLRSWFMQLEDKYFGSWFWYPPIDVMCLAMFYLRNKRAEMPNFKLHTVAKTFEISVSESTKHRAMDDIRLTKKIYEKIVQGSEGASQQWKHNIIEEDNELPENIEK